MNNNCRCCGFSRANRRTAGIWVRRFQILLLIFVWPLSSLAADTWTFSALKVSSLQREGDTSTLLDGNARVESAKMLITADHLELKGENSSLIEGNGSAVLEDKDRGLRIEAERFSYNRTDKIIRFRNLVSLVDEEGGLVIRCESMDFLEEEELVVMQVAVRLIRDDIVCRGEFATYRRQEEILELSGKPVVWRDTDEYRADRITVNLDTDEILMEGAVEGALTTKDNEETSETSDADAPDASDTSLETAEEPAPDTSSETAELPGAVAGADSDADTSFETADEAAVSDSIDG